jgi:uncharacterized repeat protein (TIGR02543 family)
VNYNANGSTGGTVPAAQTKIHNIDLTLANNSGNLVKTGFFFAGWSTAADGGTNYGGGSIYSANTGVTLYARWTEIPLPTNLTATCSNDGTQVTVSWERAPGYSSVYFRANPTSSYDTTTQSWPRNDSWDDNLQANTKTVTVTPGASYTVWVHTRSGNAWSPLIAREITCSDGPIPSPTNLTATCSADGTQVTVNWTRAPGYSSVYFRANPTSSYDTTTQSWPRNDSWDDNLQANTKTVTVTPGVRHTVWVLTRYGSLWSPLVSREITCLTPAVTYPVTYNANGATGGTIPAAQTKTNGVTLTLAANSGNLVKTGYTFAGWNTTIAGNGTNYAVSSAYTANSAVILYAKWTAIPVNNYTITFNKNDADATGTTATQTIASGASANLTANGFNNPGFTFAGWATTAT